MEKNARIFVAGSGGLVGSAVVRGLQRSGHSNLLIPRRKELDLTDQAAVRKFFSEQRPEYVFLAAAKVGGIVANNSFPVEFLLENLAIQNNVLTAAHAFEVKKLLFLGSSCIYPRLAKQPIKESELLNGHLEPTNSAYAIAKIAGIELCQSYRREYNRNFISAMPTNLYGPNDNYHPEHSHVIPGLIRRFHEAKAKAAANVSIWGTGKPLREFLHADDLAAACLFLMQSYDDSEIINVGSGEEISIGALAMQIAEVVGFEGEVLFDLDKPDGAPRKFMDSSRLFEMGWKPTIKLKEGLKSAYEDFLKKNA